MIQEGEGHWPNSSENLQKARYLWVLRTPQNNKEEGARTNKLVTCGTRDPLGRGQSVPFSAGILLLRSLLRIVLPHRTPGLDFVSYR